MSGVSSFFLYLRWQRIRLQCGRPKFDPWVGKIPWRGRGNPFQYSCLENPQGQCNLADYSPWGSKESDMTEQLSAAQHKESIFEVNFKVLTLD